MEKILQILVVFGLLAIIILYNIRSREKKFRDFFFSRRSRLPLVEGPGWLHSVDLRVAGDADGADEMAGKGVAEAVGGGDEMRADQTIFDKSSALLYCYRVEGTLSIFRILDEERHRELQRLVVPGRCSGFALDPVRDELYFYSDGEVFVFSK